MLIIDQNDNNFFVSFFIQLKVYKTTNQIIVLKCIQKINLGKANC